MAVKKCDDIVEETEVPAEEAEGTTATTTQNETSQVKENSYLGKSLTAVERNIYDDISDELVDATGETLQEKVLTTFGNARIHVVRAPDIADPLRADAKKFFVRNTNNQVVYLNSDLSELGASVDDKYGTSPITVTSLAPATVVSGSNSGSLFKVYQQGFEVSSNQFISNTAGPAYSDELFNEAWSAFVNGGTSTLGLSRPSPLIDIEGTYTDHNTNITVPFSEEELEVFLNNVNNPAYAKVNGKYNFFSPGYEEYIKSADVKEYQLQNQFSNITREASYIQESLFTFGPDLSYIINVQALQQAQGFDITEKYQNIGIPSSQVPEIKKVTDTDDLYTMINTIEFNTDRTGLFLASSDESGLTDELLKHVMDQTIIYPGDIDPAAAANSLPFVLSNEQIAFTGAETIITTNQTEEEVQLINLGTWLSSYFSTTGTEPLNEQFVDVAILLGVDPNAAETSDECSAFANTLKAMVLSGKINNLVEDSFRTFEEMLAGKEAYNETVIYEILKTSTDNNAQQRIFVPNTEELDILQYIDTQIKYDKNYTYNLFAHQLIIGTEYKYFNFTGAQTDKTARFAVEYKPSLQIARLPVFSESTRVLDNAPVFPDVNLVPYKGVATRILINLNSNVGDYDLQPIIINEADTEFVAKFREARGLRETDPIKFKTDDPVNQFEIYRTTEPPMSYSDFTGQLHATISSSDAVSTSLVDEVEPNIKYYYTFRTIDVHGNRSNPTDVYMAELVQFEGMIFFNTRVYNFEGVEYDNVKTSRDFRRYFKINPNLIQSLINYEESIPDGSTESAYNAASIALGRAEEPVWNKRFKIRITSKNSGKKFDINLNCKVDYTRPSGGRPFGTPDLQLSIPKPQPQATGDLKADIYKSRGEALASESAFNTVADSLSVLNRNKAITTYVPDTVQAQIDSFIADIKTGDFTEDLAMDIRNTFLGLQSNGSISGFDMELLGEAIDGITNIVELKFGSTAMINNMMQKL